jgi:hypothetical protein
MKKLFTLLMLMVCSIGMAWAADYVVTAKRTISSDAKTSTWETISANGGSAIQNSETALGEGMYFVAAGKCTMGGQQINIKANAIMYLEVPSATAEGTVKIITGNATDRYFETPSGGKLYMKGDNSSLDFTSSDIEKVDGVNYLKLISKSDNKFNGVSITLTSSDSYVQLVKLAAPTITVDSSTGKVTIGSVENATMIAYTTDGSIPTSSSETYQGPFTAEDGQTIQAIAIGDGVAYDNSSIASKLVMLDNATIAAPAIKQINGTVAITCETAGTTIEYSLDGTTYTDYTRAFTLEEDGTVYARAKRGENASEVASAEVATISKGEATKTIWMGYGSFTNNTENEMTGAEGDDAEGIVLAITGNTEKKWSSGGKSIKIGDVSRTAIKLSNGAQNTLTLPDGMTATRITFYSFINDAVANGSYWKEFNGVNISGDVPMGATSNLSDPVTTPDVRVFPMEGESSSITFTNAGQQLCFIIALDVIESPEPTIKATSEIAVKAVPFNKTSTGTVTLKGSNLEDGTYYVEMPEVDGLSIEPASFTVTDGAVEQEFTVTYSSDDDVESATATIVFSDGTTLAETTVTYESRATAYEQVEVSTTATWDWTGQKEIVELGDNTTPTQKAETLMAEFETLIDFGESFGDAKAIAVEGMQYPSRNGFAQGSGSIKIKTTVPGYVTLVYSNTGSSNANRWPTINGAQFGDEAIGTTKTTAKSPVVPAGEVAIKGTGALRYYTVIFTPADAPAVITAEITDAGYATFSSLFEVEIPDGVEAYYASASDGSTVTMTSIDGGVIPAGTGVVLKGEPGSYTMAVSNTGVTLDGTNLLKANIADRTPGEAEYYTLAAGPKFSKSTGGVLAAGKAYLVIPGGSARIVTMTFDGETTGISELKSVAEEGALYNLSGARVSKPTKGLYIQNGKKLIVK